FCSLLAPSDAILFQEGVSVKLRLPQVDGDNFTDAKRHRSNRAITVNSNHMTPLHCANEGRTKLLRAQ
uniref:hypothetical protein n=1 Tax=Shigella sp. FJ201304 TaxID=3156197 RepID=UPI003395EAF4